MTITARPAGKESLPPKPYRETPDVADATCRLVRSVGKRVATEDPDGLQSLVDIGEALRWAWQDAVAGLRATGYSDREIGAELGITRQAVEQRWPR
jgi:DNA-binding NarL/FixJ family response regulator